MPKTKTVEAIKGGIWICDIAGCGQPLVGTPDAKILVCPTHGEYHRKAYRNKVRYVAEMSGDIITSSEMN